MRLGVIKPLETRKFIVVSRQYLGNTEAEVIELWKNVMVGIMGTGGLRADIYHVNTTGVTHLGMLK